MSPPFSEGLTLPPKLPQADRRVNAEFGVLAAELKAPCHNEALAS